MLHAVGVQSYLRKFSLEASALFNNRVLALDFLQFSFLNVLSLTQQ